MRKDKCSNYMKLDLWEFIHMMINKSHDSMCLLIIIPIYYIYFQKKKKSIIY